MIEDLLLISGLMHPEWLLLPLAVFAYHIYALLNANHALPARYYDKHMTAWYSAGNQQRLLSVIIYITLSLAFWLFLAIALAQPYFKVNVDSDSQQHTQSTTLIFIDNSRSMNIQDVGMSRLQRALIEIKSLITHSSENSAFGISLYSAKTHTLVPPTTDKTALLFYTDMIKAEMLPYSGSSFNSVLNEIVTFQNQLDRSHRNARVLILSDGDFTDSTTLIDKDIASRITIPVYSYTIGKSYESPVPSQDEQDLWVRYDDKIIYSKRQDEALKNLSEMTGGHLSVVNDAKIQSIKMLDTFDAMITHSQTDNSQTIPVYQFFLFIAAIALFFLNILQKDDS